MKEFLKSQNGMIILVLAAFVLILLLILFFTTNRYKLNQIKNVRVGDGQHGNATWMNEADLEKHFKKVIMPEKLVDKEGEFPVGRVIHYIPETRTAYVDTSDSHCAVEAPTAIGKTSEYVIPNIVYNAMAGASMIAPDIKGELYRILAKDLMDIGYNVQKISFYDVQSSLGVDYMSKLNDYIEKSKNALFDEEREYYQAKAESECKLIANSITSTRERSNTENGFFKVASNGLIASILYLVSFFGKDTQKHFSSVRSVVQNLGSVGKNKSALSTLLENHDEGFPARKLSGAAYSASKETESNIYSATLSDLDIYTDAEAEQVTSTNKEKFDWKSLINSKTIVFIELPETRKEKFAFFTLFLSQIYESLTKYAQGLKGNKLPKIIKIIWDEFGISPKLLDLPQMLNVSRGRGILFDLIYQSQDQVEEIYGKIAKEIIRKACNTNLYLGLSSVDISTAEDLSKILGNYTIKSGSISRSKNHEDWVFNRYSESITEQMIERRLMTADELLRLRGKKILLKQNLDPFRPTLIGYYKQAFYPKMKYTKQSDELIDEFKDWRKIDYINFEDIKHKLATYVKEPLPSVNASLVLNPIYSTIGYYFNTICEKLKIVNPTKLERKAFEIIMEANGNPLIQIDDEIAKLYINLKQSNHILIEEFNQIVDWVLKNMKRKISTQLSNRENHKEVHTKYNYLIDYQKQLNFDNVKAISCLHLMKNK